jgi:sugar lactone lactonase YvrE
VRFHHSRLLRWVIPLLGLCLLAGGGTAAAAALASSSQPAAAGPAASASPAAVLAGAEASAPAANATVPSGTLAINGGGTSFALGTSITFNYTASTVNAENWVGVYQASQTPTASVGSAVWSYAPDASGSVTLSTADLDPGVTYEAWLLYDDEYGEMSSGVTFTVTASGTITIDGSASVVDGKSVTFDYTANPTNAENWIGIYSAGQTPGDVASTIWTYTPDASGTATFSTAALQPGSYQAFLLYDNGYADLAAPVSFTVTPAPTVPQPVYQRTIGGPASLSAPSGVATDSAGDVWVTDADNDQVTEFSASGGRLRSFGTKGSGNGQLSDPEAIAVSGGDVYVADAGNNRVEEFTTAGQFVRTIGGPGTGNGQFTDPEGVAVNSSGDLYVADTAGNRVEEFSGTGSFLSTITAGMSNPQGLAVDASGDLWVAQNGMTDTSADAVIEYSPTGTQLQSVGRGNTAEYGGMSNPSDVALDASGNVYVTDPDYDLVEEFSDDSLYEGEFGTPSVTDGVASASGSGGTLYLPSAVAVDAAGDVFVADRGDHRVAEFAPQVGASVAVQPAPATVYAGFPAIFHATAAGKPAPTVQWEAKAPGATSFTPVKGAVSDTLVLPATRAAQSGTQYEAVFSNALGTVTSKAVALTVKALPRPLTPPDHPGGPGAPGMKSWPTSPSWPLVFTWPGVPAWPGSPSGRPSVSAPTGA